MNTERKFCWCRGILNGAPHTRLVTCDLLRDRALLLVHHKLAAGFRCWQHELAISIFRSLEVPGRSQGRKPFEQSFSKQCLTRPMVQEISFENRSELFRNGSSKYGKALAGHPASLEGQFPFHRIAQCSLRQVQ